MKCYSSFPQTMLDSKTSIGSNLLLKPRKGAVELALRSSCGGFNEEQRSSTLLAMTKAATDPRARETVPNSAIEACSKRPRRR